MTKHRIKTDGTAVCYECGVDLIAPADGQPYWCTECSQEEEERMQRGR